MRIFVLFVNYFILSIAILASLSFLKGGFNPQVFLGVWIMLFMSIPNLIYIHMNKPVDTEKEELKKKISELEKKETL